MKKALKNKTAKVVLIGLLIRLSFIVLIVFTTDHMVSEPAKRNLMIATAVFIYTLGDAIVYIKLFEKETREYLGWQRLWLYPSNQILVSLSVLAICIIGSIIYMHTSGNTFSKESIATGITTGVIASCIIVLFSELSNNHKNNMKRLSVLNDFFSIVYFYKDDIDLNKKMVERDIEKGELQLFNYEIVLNTIKESGESGMTVASYTALEIQAVAWEVSEYWQLLSDTLHSHSELLYISEIKSLNNIARSVNSINSIILTSQMIDSNERELQRLKNGITFSNGKPDNQEVTIERYLLNLSKEENEIILTNIVVALIIVDQNMKLLNQNALYLDEKEFKHLIHLQKKVERTISRKV